MILLLHTYAHMHACTHTHSTLCHCPTCVSTSKTLFFPFLRQALISFLICTFLMLLTPMHENPCSTEDDKLHTNAHMLFYVHTAPTGMTLTALVFCVNTPNKFLFQNSLVWASQGSSCCFCCYLIKE